MKYLVLFLFLISFNLFAEGFIPVSKIGLDSTGLTIESKKSRCEKRYNEYCVKIDNKYNYNFYKKVAEKIDDYSSPVYSKKEVESCADKADCELKLSLKDCSIELENAKISKDYSEIYCTKFLRYNKKLSGKQIAAEDAVLKESYRLQRKAENDAKKLKKDAIRALKNKESLTSQEMQDAIKYLLKNL